MSPVKLYLDNCNEPLFPGQTISGRVECNFTEETSLRAVKVRFAGRAVSQWDESDHGDPRSPKQVGKARAVRFSGEEVFFDAEYKLVDGGEGFSLPAGKHVYPFSYVLPPQLPSSFEGCHGNVRYYIKAVVDRPWKFDYEDKVSIEVVSLLDLNFVPGARNPIAITAGKKFCSCWCIGSGTLTFNMSLPRSGYVPGQELDVQVSVQNMSNVIAESVKFTIVPEIEYISFSPRTHHKYFDGRILAAYRADGIAAHAEKSWSFKLAIPAGAVPNLIPCSILNIMYSLKAEVVVPFPHRNLTSRVLFFIGAVPLTAETTTFTQAYPGDAPYAAGAPYPSGGSPFYPRSAPYAPNDKSPSAPGEAAYPGATPYLSGGSSARGAPYPPSGLSSSGSYPERPGPAVYPGGGVLAPPLYSEAEKLLEKK